MLTCDNYGCFYETPPDNCTLCGDISHGDLVVGLRRDSRKLDVMSNCCCKYKHLEFSRLLTHADMCTIELPKTFHQVTQLLLNTNKIVLL